MSLAVHKISENKVHSEAFIIPWYTVVEIHSNLSNSTDMVYAPNPDAPIPKKLDDFGTYEIVASGINSRGNTWRVLSYGRDAPNQNSYYYLWVRRHIYFWLSHVINFCRNQDGSSFYSYPDGSTWK